MKLRMGWLEWSWTAPIVAIFMSQRLLSGKVAELIARNAADGF